MISQMVFKNRHTDPLPTLKATIIIDLLGEKIECDWIPYDPINHCESDLPAEGYIGTAHEKSRKIGHHDWAQNDSEFILYHILS